MTDPLAQMRDELDALRRQGVYSFDELKGYLQFSQEAADLYARVVAACGEKLARSIWSGTPPKRGQGHPPKGRLTGRDLEVLYADIFNRSPDIVTGEAMTAVQSATKIHDRLGYGNSPEAAEKAVRRVRRTAKQGFKSGD